MFGTRSPIPRPSALAAALLLAGGITACSSQAGDSSAEQPELTTAPAVSEEQSTQVATVTQTVEETVAKTTVVPQPAQPAAQPEPAAPDLSVRYDIGDPVRIAGQDATVCVYGDGFGTNIWAANDATSCDFAKAVLEQLTYGLDATEQNVRATLPRTVAATSPVTGQKYQMQCEESAEKVILCQGGDGAAVLGY